ncbi:TonB-dependent receptor plug domain-containing protein [Aeromonas simiae]|uniref:TonB-dependent receptor plug domain-containing protein n=1 Tax=Aeromonas simiae TaxID=218936 RepID=UPI00266C591C|nr:TonB-dependent receptor [Aeromonas simiae]MDO2948110.1 TonB-dependent receptor [Aeromonas simiae]MDO2952850.1 TonB-dependent receptor [Aeromonas simiae]MDO2955471.1 TonB-dependent receptor [Aeromonas simiae]
MLRKSRLSAAIALALVSAAAAAPSVFAAEEGQNVEKLQKIKVTGSRISRVDVEGATPVVSVSKVKIEQSGQQTVADYLKQASYNSFGGYSAQSGSSFQSQATVGLRGLGSERTLVLLNGKRVAGSPTMGGTAINLNTIPMSAVERVEVNLDGGSAIYGSDAIGGVVNVVLKEGYEGLEFQGRLGSPTEDGGDEKSGSILAGIAGEKGSLMAVYEHDKKDIIYAHDRDYLSKQGNNAPSVYGRNVEGITGTDTDGKPTWSYGPLAGATNADGTCKEPFVNHDGGCNFNYGKFAATTASRSRDTLYVNGRYHINDSVDFVPQLIASRVESFGRFAPAAGSFAVDPSNPKNAQFFTDNGLDAAATLGAGEMAYAYYRFNNVGTRDNLVTDTTGSMNLGFEGTLPTESVGDMQWNAGYMYSKTDNKENGTGYVLKSAAQQAVADGKLVKGEFDASTTASMTADTSRRSTMDFYQWYAGVQWDMGELPAGPVSWYAGAEYNDWVYEDKYDAQSEAGNVIGSSGNSSGGERDVTALYLETLVPVTEQVELSVAGRYDKYSDFGSAFSPKASVRYQPLDNLMLRTSWSRSFRAPSLSDLYSADSFSADWGKDYVYCQANGIAAADCPNQQYDTTRTSNEDLKEETADTWNFGFSYSPLEDLNLSLDYYTIKIDDVIQLNSLQSLIYDELNNGGSPYIVRNSQGKIKGATAPMVNLGTLKTSGLDFKLDYRYDFPMATVRYDFGGTYILKFEEGLYAGGPSVDKIGWNGLPQMRFNSGVGVNVPQWWNMDAYLSANYIDSQSQDYIADTGKEVGHIASNTVWNINVGVQTPWDGKVQVGVKNMFNREPSLESDGFTYDENIYSIDGRVYYLDYTQKF